MTEQGIRVFNVPLISTLTLNNGFNYSISSLSRSEILLFQIQQIKMQMKLEDHFTDIALLSKQKSVILCDRGVMDPFIFLDSHEWQMVLDDQNWNLVNLRDRRYDAVIHMTTSAKGAEEYFMNENQEVGGKELKRAKKAAIEMDEKLRKAWMGHPHYM